MTSETPTRISLNILDTYKVRWSAETTARDVVQNFFDEVEDFDTVIIDIDDTKKVVQVSGPSEVAPEYLQYVGATTKAVTTTRTAGGFGEGFKICALVLLRDFGAKLIAGSRGWQLEAMLIPHRFGRELCYQLETVSEQPGSFVRIENAPKRLRDTFQTVRDEFRHSKNPRLSKPVYVNETAGLGIWYAHRGTHGDIFYRRQRRGVIRFSAGHGLSFGYDSRIETIEGDRDRRDLRVTLPIVSQVLHQVPVEVLEKLVFYLRPYWKKGHRVLTACLRELKLRNITLTFPPKWVAKERYGFFDHEVDRRGLRLAGSAFAAVGMKSVTQVLGGDMEPRPLTAVEATRVRIAREFYRRMSGYDPVKEIVAAVDLSHEMSAYALSNNSATIASKFLNGDFAEGISQCALIFAGANTHSISTADLLTRVIENALLQPSFHQVEQRWNNALTDPDADTTVDMTEFESAITLRHPKHFVIITIAGPPGCPLLDEIANDIQRIGKHMSFEVGIHKHGVHDIPSMLKGYYRGFPAIRTSTSNHEWEPTRGQPFWGVRRFSSGTIRPTVESIQAGLIRASKERDRRKWRMPAISVKGRKALLKWCKTHDLERWKELTIIDCYNAAVEKTPWPETVPWQFQSSARQCITRDFLPTLGLATDDLTDRMEQRLSVYRESMVELINHMTSVLSQSGNSTERKPIESVMMTAVTKRLENGASVTELMAMLTEQVPLMTKFRQRITPPEDVDVSCINTCLEYVLSKWFEGSPSAGDSTGEVTPTAETLDTLETLYSEVVAVVRQRHMERDNTGTRYSCHETGTHIKNTFDPPTPPKDTRVPDAVKKAWYDALAEGATEEEAFARCLDVTKSFWNEAGKGNLGR